MCTVSRRAALALVFLAVAASPALAQLEPAGVPCVPADGNALTLARITSSAPVEGARVYFRARGREDWYFLEMEEGKDGERWAVLPIPERKTTAVEYRLFMQDVEGRRIESAPVTVEVSGKCTPNLNLEQLRYASNLIIGLTRAGQPEKPEGFSCIGVSSIITLDNQLRPSYPCLAVTQRYPSPDPKQLDTIRQDPVTDFLPSGRARR